MKIIAIVVTYNGMKWYQKCFDSLKNSSIPVETIVIDNKSADNTVSFIKENYPDIHLIESDKNMGFGKANNIGLKFALEQNADYVFLLNQDAWVKPDTIEKLVEKAIENPEYGILSPIHLAGDENLLDANFSSYINPTDCPQLLSDLLIKGKSKNRIYPVNFVNAALWLISRKSLHTVGGFDPIFPHYGEDDNYISRLNIHGLKVGIYPFAFGVHDRNQDEKKRSLKQNRNRNFISCLIKLCDARIIFRKALYWSIYPVFMDIINNIFHLNFPKIYANLYVIIKLITYSPQIIKSRRISREKGLNYL